MKKNCRPSSCPFPRVVLQLKVDPAGVHTVFCALQKLEKFCEDVKGKGKNKKPLAKQPVSAFSDEGKVGQG